MADLTADETKAMEEITQMLEIEPASGGNAIAQPDIPALREELVILVSTGKSKEAIGVELTQDRVKRMEAKEVEKYYKRYETYVGT